MRATRMFIYFFALCSFSLCNLLWSQEPAPGTIEHDILWAKGDTGNVNCPYAYTNLGVETCIANDGRKCVIGRAISEAKRNECSNAFQLVMLTQCHDNGKEARDRLNRAGTAPVCSFLKTLDPPPPPPQKPPPVNYHDPTRHPEGRN